MKVETNGMVGNAAAARAAVQAALGQAEGSAHARSPGGPDRDAIELMNQPSQPRKLSDVVGSAREAEDQMPARDGCQETDPYACLGGTGRYLAAHQPGRQMKVAI